MTLLSVKTAQRRILRILPAVRTERVSLASAHGRVLATDVRSIDLPLFDNSSVDGYAVRAPDVSAASRRRPVRLQVIADIPAGTFSAKTIRTGQAARIMTGAPIPRGATAIVMIEDTDDDNSRESQSPPASVKVLRASRQGENIRRRGMDVARGKKVLGAGKGLSPQDLGLLSMLGQSEVLVHRIPRVAYLSSGDELAAPGARLRPGQIRDTNSLTMAGLIREAGAEPLVLGIARDNRKAIEALLDRALQLRADLIVSTAGVSVGAFDLVREAIESSGRLLFWRVKVRPGKPLAFGKYRNVPFIGLPGNPVSAFVGFQLFIAPAIAKLAGRKTIHERPVVPATLQDPIASDGRESYLRAIVTRTDAGHVARLTGHQGSGNLLSLVQANALLMIPAGVKSLAVGDRVNAWLM